MVDNNKVKNLLEKLYKLNYWFCNQMLEYEAEVKEFEKACEEAKKSNNPVIIISGASENAKCMKSCMEDTVKVINFLRNEENLEYIEPWQMAGAEAMFEQCSKDKVIPFDLPAILMAVFEINFVYKAGEEISTLIMKEKKKCKQKKKEKLVF